MKGDKAAAAAKSRPEWRSWRETKWRETRQHRQPAENGDYEGRLHEGGQGGSGSQWRSGRETRRQRHHDHLAIVGSATQSLRSKNPYSFQLSREWGETNEGRGSEEQARMEITKRDKRENGDHEGGLNEGGQGGTGSQEQAKMEIMKGD